MKLRMSALPIFLLLPVSIVQATEKFEQAEIHLEQNATDNDVEIVIKATGGNKGMKNLKVVSPNGKTVVDYDAKDLKMGMRHFSFESPEPKNDGSIQKDFPAGEYTFRGKFMNGKTIQSKSSLNHNLPAAAMFEYPKNDDENVPNKNLTIKWLNKDKPASIIVVVEQESTGEEIKAYLPGETESFSVPDGFLKPGTAYKMSVGTIAKNNNGSYSEIEIKTKN